MATHSVSHSRSFAGLNLSKALIVAAMALIFGACPVFAAPPPNDNFANATVLTSGVKVSGTLDEATREPGDPDDNTSGRGTVWFRWTAPASGVVRMSLVSSMNFNNLVTMIGGSAATGVYLTADGPSSTFYAVGGQTYHIAFFAYRNLVNPNTYSLTLAADATLPAGTKLVPPYSNDDFSAGYVVAGSAADLVVHTLYATVEPFEHELRESVNGLSLTYINSQAGGTWFNWTAPVSGTATVTARTLATGKHTLLLVGTGGSIPSIQGIAADFDGTQFPCTAGVTYHIYLLNPFSDMAFVQLSTVATGGGGGGGGGGSGSSFADQSGTFAGMLGTSGTIKLVLNKTGTFTGNARSGGVNYTLKGKLDANGDFVGTVGNPPAAASLHADLTVTHADPGAYVLAGSLAGTSFAARHSAYVKGQSAVEAGRHTLLLAPTSNAATIPQGTGTGTLTISNAGVVTAKGKLAEGTSWSASGPLTGVSGQHEFILSSAALYKGKGTFAGKLAFANLPGSDAAGSISWIKPPLTESYFAAGFATTLSATSARYVAPARGEAALDFPAVADNARLTLASGGLAAPIQIDGTLTSANGVLLDTPNPAKVSVRISASSGVWSGSFVDPVTSKQVKWTGVLFQKSAPRARGFFLGPVIGGAGTSGDALLAPSP